MMLAFVNMNSLFAATFLLLDSDNGDVTAALPLLLCLSGFVYFGVVYARYRNSGKRHRHEQETLATLQNLQQYDRFSKHRKGLRNSQMAGRNDHQIEGALNEGGGGVVEQLTNVRDSLGKR
jgi:hypothetical protein